MKFVVVGAVAVLALAGCSRSEESVETPQTSQVTINVNAPSGTPVNDVTVVAATDLGDGKTQIAESKTDGNGQAVLTLPENAQISIGLWKQQDNYENVYNWQIPFIVPVSDTSLSYSYYYFGNNCPVVTPGQDTPCPAPSPATTPSYDPYGDGAVTDWGGSES